MKKHLSTCFYVVSLSLITTASQAKSDSWSVRSKAELVARIFLAKKPKFDSTGSIDFCFPRTAEYFRSDNLLKKKEDADNAAKLIFSYVLADSLRYYSRVKLYFSDATDSVCMEYPCSEKAYTDLRIVQVLPEDRQLILGYAIPYPNLIVSNPSQKYKKRIMGYSLPDHLLNGEPMYSIQMERYSMEIAAVLYDYVLQRNNDIVSKVIIKYSHDYTDLNSPRFAEMVYVMDKWLFKEIKEKNVYPLTYE